MTKADFHRWLDGIALTSPFTLADAKELYSMIKGVFPNAFVEVYKNTDKVRVCVGSPGSELVRDLDVV